MGSIFDAVFTPEGSLLHADQHPTWFSGDSTVILGSGELKGNRKEFVTRGKWNVTLFSEYVEEYEKGYLVIGCLRFFGGLHSSQYGACVKILFNEKYIDGFSLLIKPPEHSDFFHRIPTPNLPNIWPLSACQTLYVWPIQKSLLKKEGSQTVAVEIDAKVSWDVDYVAIICTGNEK